MLPPGLVYIRVNILVISHVSYVLCDLYVYVSYVLCDLGYFHVRGIAEYYIILHDYYSMLRNQIDQCCVGQGLNLPKRILSSCIIVCNDRTII